MCVPTLKSRRDCSRMLGHFRVSPSSRTTDTRGLDLIRIDPVPDRINLYYFNVLCCEYRKHEVMTLSIVGDQPKKRANPFYKAIKQIERTFLTSHYSKYFFLFKRQWHAR